MNIKEFMAPTDEKPLDRILSDGGFAAIFRTVACVGDSLSSGEFASVDEKGLLNHHDMMEYSWGQFMARTTGARVYNFSRGGMTAKEYCESFAEGQGFWDKDKAAEAYIIALGVNDIVGRDMPLGSIYSWKEHGCDVDYIDWRNNNTDTFLGAYAQIVSRYKEISPDAKFFFVTMPRESYETPELAAKKDAHAGWLHRLAARFSNTYVIDLREYAPIYDQEFRESFFLGGHMNAMGYVLTAKMILSYIDYIIRHNPKDFNNVPFIGKGIGYRRF
jgi:lysophospholipase L1-like esterase